MMKCKITAQCINQLANVPPCEYETGGILGCENGVISHIEIDKILPITDKNEYSPNTEYLNEIILDWYENGIDFCGIFHTHPKGQSSLSKTDIEYINKIFSNIPCEVNYLYFPIVIPKEEIYFYRAVRVDAGIVVEKEEVI